METMLHDALMVRLLFRAWGRLPPLGSDATSERALVGAQAAGKYLSSPNFARESWLGWVEALHRLGATNLLKELKVRRVWCFRDLDVLAYLGGRWWWWSL